MKKKVSRKELSAVFLAISIIIILPLLCILFVLHMYFESHNKYNDKLKIELEHISEIVDSNRKSLENLCEYELSNKSINDSKAVILKNGEYQIARNIIFIEMGFSEGYITNTLGTPQVEFIKSWGPHEGICIVYLSDEDHSHINDEAITVGDHFYIYTYRT